MSIDVDDLLKYSQKEWSEGGSALEGLKSLIRIPNLSPAYDPNFLSNGLIHKAITSTKEWIESQNIKGMTIHVYDEPNRVPLLLIKVKGSNGSNSPNVLAYGHLDKMPHLDPKRWSEGLSPTNPVIKGDLLYGRGVADDGYSTFLIFSSFKYLQDHNLEYPNLTVLLETGEESGNKEVQKYCVELSDIIGSPDFVFILDSATNDYTTFWSEPTLRGMICGELSVQHLATPCHSGMATGLVPSTFRIIRQLLSRIEDEKTGEILIKEANMPTIEEWRIDQVRKCVEATKDAKNGDINLLPGSKMLTDDRVQQLINQSLKPGLEITGCDGIPSIQNGSNVMRPETRLKLSLRIPPGVDSKVVSDKLKEVLERDPPYGAKVKFTVFNAGNGFDNSILKPKLDKAIKEASLMVFHKEALVYGGGGSLSLCDFMKTIWPNADILVTGALGPGNNPHGYDENLNLPFTAKFAAAFTIILNKCSV